MVAFAISRFEACLGCRSVRARRVKCDVLLDKLEAYFRVVGTSASGRRFGHGPVGMLEFPVKIAQIAPLVESNQNLKAETLFMLGFSNFKMENIMDSLKFNQQCAAIKSPFQAQAAKNVAVIKAQYRAVK